MENLQIVGKPRVRQRRPVCLILSRGGCLRLYYFCYYCKHESVSLIFSIYLVKLAIIYKLDRVRVYVRVWVCDCVGMCVGVYIWYFGWK